jgi:hypothetical protein
MNIAIYTRKHNYEAWKIERVSNPEAAKLAQEVNEAFGVETLLVPMTMTLPVVLDSYQSQADFLAI